VVPCHHYMARPEVVDGGDGLQIWKVAANMLLRNGTQSLELDGFLGTTHNACMGDIRILAGKHQRKRPLKPLDVDGRIILKLSVDK